MNTRAPLWERRPHLCAAVIMVVFAVIRLWMAASGGLNLIQDEAQYWDWSRRLQLSYYSKGPLIAWLIAAGTSLFGDTELGVRVFAVFGNLVAQAFIYALPVNPAGKVQKFLLVEHIFRGCHHFTELPHFGGQFQFDGTAVFAVHEIFIFLGKTVYFVSQQEILQKKK